TMGTYPEGITAISRWLSEGPQNSHIHQSHPNGMPAIKPLRPQWAPPFSPCIIIWFSPPSRDNRSSTATGNPAYTSSWAVHLTVWADLFKVWVESLITFIYWLA